MSKSKKIIFIILMILIIAVVFIGNIVFSSSIIFSEDETKATITFGSPYAPFGGEFNNIYCIRKGASFRPTTYTFKVSGWNDVKDRKLAYILSLSDNVVSSRATYGQGNSKNNEVQHLLWYYIDHNPNSEDIKAMKELGGTITGGGWTLDGTNAYYTINGKKYTEVELYNEAEKYGAKTELENINLTLDIIDSNIRATWTGNAEKYNVYINDSSTAYKTNISANSINIPITEFGNNSIAKVKVAAVEEVCTAKFRVFINENAQNLLEKDASREMKETKNTVETIELNTNVSLQKYITKVNNTDLTTNDTILTDRKNTYTSADEDNITAKKVVSKSEENSMKSVDTYKKEKIVNIEAGDAVTYRIYVYNNSSAVDAKSLLIKDTIPYVVNNGTVTSLATIESIKDANGANVSWTVDTSKGENGELINKNTYQYTVNNLAHGLSTFFDVTLKYNEYYSGIITNTAWIANTDPKNDEIYRTLDRDYVKMKEYKVSLEKFVYKVNDYEMCDFDNSGSVNIIDAELLRKYVSEFSSLTDENVKNKIIKYGDLDGNGRIDINDFEKYTKYLAEMKDSNIKREGFAEHNYDDDTTTNNSWKYNHIVTVSKGDKVTYKIKLMNDGESSVYITEVTDFFPNGVKFGDRTFNGTQYNIKEIVTENGIKFAGDSINGNTILEPGKSKTFEVTVEVTESNMSLNVLKNTATISQMKNRNGIVVNDTTPNNNTDSDYLQLDFSHNNSIFSGMVWIDKNQSKDNSQNGYNALYQGNGETESKLAGIVVKLYRNGINSAIATKTTDGNGYYYFEDEDIDKNVVKNGYERHIKGPMVSDTVTRWAGTYYAYHIEFEYDGITYTSTPDGKTCISVTDNVAYSNGTYKINSNANEDFETRKGFNDKFNPINKDSLNDAEKIDYTAKNEEGYIPQAVYNYKPFMKMKSSTETIQLSDSAVLEEEIKCINLGLRGRDIFDLELTSDVAKIDVTVNNVQQTYEFTNKVTVRKAELGADTNIIEDMANIENEASKDYVNEYNNDGQKVRNTDKPYLNSVYVTYKITVQNTSKTLGTATKIINYYDTAYKFERAYWGNDNLNTTKSTGGEGYKSIIIDTPQTALSQSATMDIYVVYKLKDISKLRNLSNTDKLATYNMAEIYEYKTYAKDNDNEYVRGLIDKDSAPGNTLTEKVCLSDGNSNLSTVDYYFNKQGLNKLKYEDDTYATPTLYFVSDSNERTLTGYVFEDSINEKVLKEDRIKTGNGIKDEGEKGIKGVNVTLYVPTSMNDKGYIKYKATTGNNGLFTISGFIPGENVDLTYWYGDSDKTFCKATNGKSYNGEDFESANNSGISTKENYWYIVNSNKNKKALSVATDVESDGGTEIGTRKGVSTRVSKYGDKELEILNKVRAGIITETADNSEERKVREDTKMHSKSSKFILTVEKADENGAKIANNVEKYEVPNMNFGIQEVPVTTLDLKSTVKELIIIDAAGENIIASAKRELNNDGTWTGKWKITGNILAPTIDTNKTVNTSELTRMLDVSIEEEKLQGAKLKIKYEISAEQHIERDFKGDGGAKAVITGLIDYVDNDLSYSDDSVIESNITNSKYWKVITYDAAQEEFKKALKARGEIVSDDKKYGSIDPEGKEHTTILKADSQNPLLTETSNNVSCDLVLEKILSAHDNTLSDIVASTVETYDYDNKVEITGLDYSNTVTKINDVEYINVDRVRTPELEESSENYVTESWKTILPGINRFAAAVSEEATIHPPTGDSTEHNNTMYYVIVTVSLAVLAVGVVFIKKFAIKKD